MRFSKLISVITLLVCGVVFIVTASPLMAASVTVSPDAVVKGGVVRANWSGFSGNVNVAIYKGSSFWVYAVTNVAGTGYQDLDTTGWELRSDYRVKVKLRSNTSVYQYSSYFSVSDPSVWPSTMSVTQGETVRANWSNFSGNVNVAVYKGSSFWVHAVTNVAGTGFKDLDTTGWELRSDYRVKVELRSNTSIYKYSNYISVTEPARPDLVVQNQNVNPSILEAGSSTYISCTVKNQGSGSGSSSTLKYYLSSNTTYGSGDTYLGDDDVGSLSSGGTSTESATLSIPSGTSTGTWYILFLADANSQVSESNETNNVNYTQISVSNPNVSLSSTSVVQGETVRVNWSGFDGNVNVAVYKGSSFWVHSVINVAGTGYQDLDTTGWELRSDYRIKVELRENTDVYEHSDYFAVSIPVPDPPSLISPSNYSIFKNPSTISFDWSSVDHAVEYELEIDENFTTSDGFKYYISAPATSKTISNPLWRGNNIYHWRVRARNSAGDWGEPQSVYFQFIYDSPPDAPNFNSPQSSSQFFQGESSNFCWDKPAGSIHRYWFRIVRGPNMDGETVEDYEGILEPTRCQNATFSGSQWSPGTYTAWVKAIKTNPDPSHYDSVEYEQTISWGPIDSIPFQVVEPVPDIPQNVNAVQIVKGIRITWNSVSGVGGSTPYQIYWGTDDSVDENNKSGVLVTDQTAYDHTGLDAGAAYYYRVKACNDSECSELSDLKSAQAPLADLTILLDSIPANNAQRGTNVQIHCTVYRSGGRLRPIDGYVRVFVYMNQDRNPNNISQQDLILGDADNGSFDFPVIDLDDGSETKSKNVTMPDKDGPFFLHVNVDGPNHWLNEADETNNFASSTSTIAIWRAGTPPEEEMGILARTWDNPDVYWIKYSKKWPFLDQPTFFNLGYTDAEVQWYGSGVLDGFPLGKEILRDNDQFCYRSQSNSTVFVIEEHESHAFFQWQNFEAQGFSAEDIYWAKPEGLNWIQSIYPAVDAPMIRMEPETLNY